MKYATLTSLILALVLAVYAFPSPENKLAAKEAPSHLTHVTECVDLLMRYGTDRYGEKHAPILVSILDADSRECPQNPAALDEAWRVTRRGRRNPAGANLLTDQPLLRAMQLLSALTGKRRYVDFARQYVRAYTQERIDDKGFIWWGWHRHYDVYRDHDDGHAGNPHEIHAIHAIDWNFMWTVNPDATRREIEAIWQWHVIDKRTGEINRHGDGQRGCDFSMSAGSCLEAFVFLYTKSKERAWLDRARLLADYYWRQRNPKTNLFPDRPNAGKGRFDGSSFVTSITGLYCHSLLSAYVLTGEPVFRDHAVAHLKAYAKYGYDPSTRKFWGALRLDGAPIKGPRLKSGYGQYEPRGYIDLWQPYAAGYEHALPTAQAYAFAYAMTKDPVLLEAAERFADWIRREPPPGKPSETVWYDEYNKRFRPQGTYAAHYGKVISFYLHLHATTGAQSYLHDARRFAREATSKLCHKGLFRGHPAKPYYEAMDGVGYLLYALITLDVVERGQWKMHGTDLAVQVDNRSVALRLDNW